MKEVWPLMNADKRGSKTNRSSAFIRVHQRLKLLFLLPLLFSVAVGQGVPVVTICEVLQDRDLYHGKSVVVVGRFGGTDEGGWLSTTYVRSQAEPPPGLPKGFKWDADLITNKLRDVQKTTKLKEPGDGWIAILDDSRPDHATVLDTSTLRLPNSFPATKGFTELKVK
jgi:hypothetical protein